MAISVFLFYKEYLGIYKSLIRTHAQLNELQCQSLDLSDHTKDDVTFSTLHLFNPKDGFSVIIDHRKKIINHSFNRQFINKNLEEILPADLKQKIEEIAKNKLLPISAYLVFRHQIQNTNYYYYSFITKKELRKDAFLESVDTIVLVFVVLTLFLLIMQFLIRREFIIPTQSLIRHIEIESSGVSHNPKIPMGWRPIADVVSGVFAQNRTLLKEQKKRIETLDELVSQRTVELQGKNEALEKMLIDLHKAQDQIILQEKMASLGALTAGIAHEMKNPLNFIINFSEVSRELMTDLKDQLDKLRPQIDETTQKDLEELSTDLSENMDRIKYHGERADLIIRSMLMHARGGEEIDRQRLSLNDLLSENISLSLSGFRGSHPDFSARLKTHFDQNISHIYGSSQALGRVFLNLLNNACYAVWEKKKKNPENYEPTLTIATRELEDKVEVRIRDNGNGISEEKRAKVFEPFYTTKPTGEGTGLGLSMCYDIITNQHGGALDIESEVNTFTEIIVQLPKSE